VIALKTITDNNIITGSAETGLVKAPRVPFFAVTHGLRDAGVTSAERQAVWQKSISDGRLRRAEKAALCAVKNGIGGALFERPHINRTYYYY
jgi:hypothetical protein